MYLIAIVLMLIVCNRRRWKRIEGHHQVMFCYNHYQCYDVSIGWEILEISVGYLLGCGPTCLGIKLMSPVKPLLRDLTYKA